MGTTVHLKFSAPDAVEADTAANAVFQRIEDLEETFSDYREDSELSLLSREGNKAPRTVSVEMFDLLQRSQQISEISRGAFDISIGPVVLLWRQARRTHQTPDPEALLRAKALVDYHNIELDPQNRTVYLKREGMKLDVGAIAKGYAADRALALLKSRGIESALIDAGGDLRIGAPPPGKSGWTVSIDSPDTAKGRTGCTLVLHDVGIATSGNIYQFAEVGGRHFSHIVNPASGEGLLGSASTTIIAADGITADGLATALSVLPPTEGLRAIQAVPGTQAFLVRQSPQGWQYFSSPGFPRTCDELRKRGN